MTTQTMRAKHRATVGAAPADLYGLVADVTRWPVLFGPTVCVEHLHRTEPSERFAIWALVNGGVTHWTSRREFDPVASRISFRQEHSQPPVEWMGGTWEFSELPGEGSEIVLTHEFAAAPGTEQQIREALDRNSDSELGALRRIAEAGFPVNELIFGFEDTVHVAGPVRAAYEFVDRADEWPARLPHVRRVDFAETDPGIQHLTMETVAGDGAAHTTTSIRVCRPGEWIAYKQTVPPAPLLGHSGTWLFQDLGKDGCAVTARHLVLLDPDAVSASAGLATVTGIRARVRSALSGNSQLTLEHARKFAELA